jgi:hypothetical protein
MVYLLPTIWNSTTPIGVSTSTDPIDVVAPMPNCTVTVPIFALSI